MDARVWMLLVLGVAGCSAAVVKHNPFAYIPSPPRPRYIGCAACGCDQIDTAPCMQCAAALDSWSSAESDCSANRPASCQIGLLNSPGPSKIFEAPYLYKQEKMCGPKTRQGDMGKYVQPSNGGVVVVRVDGTDPVEYRSGRAQMAPQVEYMGEYASRNDPNNTYTNYTCARRHCRTVQVYRNGSGYICDDGGLEGDGTCIVRNAGRDDALPLCHNSSELACAFWVAGGFDWIVIVPELTVFLVAMLVIAALCCWGRAPGVFCAAFVLIIMGTIGIMTAGQMLDFLGSTQVDLEYVSYQGCMRHCAIQTYDGRDRAFAMYNQCRDNNTECGTSIDMETQMRLEYCYGCQAHKDAHVWLEYASQAGRAKVWFYAALLLVILLLGKWMGYIAYRAVLVLVALNAVLSLVMSGFVTEPGQRQVMRYALTMEGDSIYSLFVSASILEILGACAVVGWLASDELESLVNTRRAGYEKAPSSILDSVSITPADVSSASRRKKTDGDGEAVKSSVGKAWEL